MRDVYQHVRETFDFVDRVGESERYTIVPKRFIVERVSDEGRTYLSFHEGEERELSGRLMTERFAGAGRTFFFPYSVLTNLNFENARFIEIKGYGEDGREICLWCHGEGDILFGMFYEYAKMEFDVLEKAREKGLRVPIPLFVGKILREEWLRSGLMVVNRICYMNDEWDIKDLSQNNERLKGEIARRMNGHFHNIQDFLSAFSRSYDAGVVGRAVISPFRVGDPSRKYELTEENREIARQCGNTFAGLIDLGYLHLSPSTANWTEAGELTDMADCHDLRFGLLEIIALMESRWNREFWGTLIGPYHTANLSPFFIEGMFREPVSLEEAAQELEQRTFQKIRELKVR